MVSMRIVMAGASGFLGSRLSRFLASRGHDVIRLVRRDPCGGGELVWHPRTGLLDPAALAGTDAVINLAGAGVARRWTAGHKEIIRDSRVDTTTTLARAIAASPASPAVLLNASAVGYYGDTGDRHVDEHSPAGDGFLAGVCRVWEAATRPAEDAGVRVVHLRTGYPLSPDGGLLKPLVLPFRLGAGGRLGGGGQYWPWIALGDWLEAVRFLLRRDDVAGPVNLVGPHPVTNTEFTAALAQVLHRPAVLPVPGPALRLVLGEFATEVLASQRVLPTVLTGAGFEFRHRDVESALRAALTAGVDAAPGSAG